MHLYFYIYIYINFLYNFVYSYILIYRNGRRHRAGTGRMCFRMCIFIICVGRLSCLHHNSECTSGQRGVPVRAGGEAPRRWCPPVTSAARTHVHPSIAHCREGHEDAWHPGLVPAAASRAVREPEPGVRGASALSVLLDRDGAHKDPVL